jgi:hypothetical protein
VRARTHHHGPNTAPRFFRVSLREFFGEHEERSPPECPVIIRSQLRLKRVK